MWNSLSVGQATLNPDEREVMYFAYADPPYPGCSGFYREKQEIDPIDVLWDLEVLGGFDGWAMSTHSPALFNILPDIPREWENIRIAVWCKPFAVFKPNVNPAYAWEPVIYKCGRPNRHDKKTVRDFVITNITLKKGLVGAKPDEFCYWLFELMGMEKDDEFFDMFPGTGRVMRAWETWRDAGMGLFCVHDQTKEVGG